MQGGNKKSIEITGQSTVELLPVSPEVKAILISLSLHFKQKGLTQQTIYTEHGTFVWRDR